MKRLYLLRHAKPRCCSFAHSSGIEDLTVLFARAGERLDAVRERFPTGALATLELRDGWQELGAGRAELVDFVTPRRLGQR